MQYKAIIVNNLNEGKSDEAERKHTQMAGLDDEDMIE
jgi:hypothetical protein